MPSIKLVNYDTSHPSPNLVPNRARPRLGWEKLSGKARPANNVDYEADGHRLWIASSSNPFIVYSVVAGLGLLYALIGGGIELWFYLTERWEFHIGTAITLSSFTIGLVGLALLLRKSEIHYFIFDRDNGTVAIPKGFFRPHYVLPFSEVECYGASYLSPHGAQLYDMKLYPKLKPRRRWEGFRNLYMEAIYDHDTADRYWSYICQFMNRQMPVPDGGLTGQLMRFLMEIDARVEDLGTDKIPKEKMEEFERKLYGMAYPDKRRKRYPY